MEKITYKNAGVDTQKSSLIIDGVKGELNNSSLVLSKIGAFSSLFKLPNGYKNPVLVSSTDGVGTKLQLACEYGIHDGVGKDLVAMCVNDLITSGGKPLFFLDYFATGKLDQNTTTNVIRSINEGCKSAGCSLIGGETAEMPGMYKDGDYDLAGFSVGIVEEDRILPCANNIITAGMSLIGIESSGFHSNGYSLIRKLITLGHINPNDKLSGKYIYEHLLKETNIYVNPVLDIIEKNLVLACANITGGGFFENLPRALPDGVGANINLSSWKAPEIYSTVFNKSYIDTEELLNVFNCGIGFIIICNKHNSEEIITSLQSHALIAYEIGSTTENQNKNLLFSGNLQTR